MYSEKSCFCRNKDTNLKANHNASLGDYSGAGVVFAVTKILI